MNKNIIITLIVLVIAGGMYWAIMGKSPITDTMNQSPITSDGNPDQGGLTVEPAAVEARKDLATKLSVLERDILILEVADATWSDGCLGLGQANESCMLALVPGFKVTMTARGDTYVYRTDKTGASVRSETNI